MEILEEQIECELCGKSEEDLSRLSANHKKLGLLMVCQDCWVRLYNENHMVSNSTSGSNQSPCATCSNATCRF